MARLLPRIIAFLATLMIATMFGLHYWARELSEFAFVPARRFTAPPPPAPAYDDPCLWISRAGGSPDDPARWLPHGATPGQPLPAAVFFVPPTSYYDRSHWNAPLGHSTTARRAELFTRGLASPFNAAVELWAPYYRQATLGAFLTDKPAGQQALGVAYADVLAAFDIFIAHADPKLPIVLVGHSQGALHIMHLLKDRMAGKPLARRVAAAYIAGWPVSLDHDLPFLGLPACQAPDQPNCILSWQSYAQPADPTMTLAAYARFPGLDGQSRQGSAFLCTNPLTGRQNDTAPASANLGTLVPDIRLTKATLTPGLVSATCAPDGFLLIGQAPDVGPYVLPGNNYHIYDIPLFWANLRDDVARRVKAWHKTSGWKVLPWRRR